MRILLIIIATCVLCVSCGIKDNPEYQAQNNYNKNIKVI